MKRRKTNISENSRTQQYNIIKQYRQHNILHDNSNTSSDSDEPDISNTCNQENETQTTYSKLNANNSEYLF